MKLLQKFGLSSTTVRLVLATGSRAGMVAPLHPGYYMIGRHGECQIRPKSRSVSRRHCLLQHECDQVRVFDLNSSSGTYVNDRKLEPRVWASLADGDSLRCGKILFHVSVKPGTDDDSSDSASMVGGAAWQADDIADFLELEDEVDREERYGRIRANRSVPGDQSQVARPNLTRAVVTRAEPENPTDSEIGTDVDLFEDVFDEDEGQAASKPPTVAAQPAKKAGASKRAELQKLKTKKPKIRGPRRSISIQFPRDPSQWKAIAAVAMLLCTVGYFGYVVYGMYSGPDVRVLDSID